MSDYFLNMQNTFKPFQDSSGFSENVLKTSEKVPKQCSCLFILQTMQFWISADSLPLRSVNGKILSVTHTFTGVSFVIKSVGTNGFSYFLFLLFCTRKLINFKTFGGWEKLAYQADHRRGEKSK